MRLTNFLGRWPALLPIVLFVLVLFAMANPANAQTRPTACNANTPNNALCIQWQAVTTSLEGPAVTDAFYRVQQRTGSTGTWANIVTNLTATRFYVENLAPGTYEFRVYAACPSCTVESQPSNVASGTATRPPLTPSAPIITIAVVISADRAPVYRIVGQAPDTRRGEFFGLVPVGRECTGPVVFRYRGESFRRVTVNQDELYGTADPRNLAAPCRLNPDA